MSDQHANDPETTEQDSEQPQGAPTGGEQEDQQESDAQREVREEARDSAEADEHSAFDAADLSDVGPEGAVDESLRNALSQMRDESQRISELGTGDEQVEAAEQFVDAAGRLDERIGSHARAEDERGR